MSTDLCPMDQLVESLGIDPEKLARIGKGEGNAFEYLPPEIREVLPELYAQEKIKGADDSPNPLVILKLFLPGSGFTWYFTEGSQDEEDFTFFGLTVGPEAEFGYTSLEELSTWRSKIGLRVERDLYFRPCRLQDIAELKGVLRR